MNNIDKSLTEKLTSLINEYDYDYEKKQYYHMILMKGFSILPLRVCNFSTRARFYKFWAQNAPFRPYEQFLVRISLVLIQTKEFIQVRATKLYSSFKSINPIRRRIHEFYSNI